MQFTWHEAKRIKNIAKHGFDFNHAHEFFAGGDMFVLQAVKNGEIRQLGIGRFRGQFCTVVFVFRAGTVRLISWRRSREKEIKAYAKREDER